MDAPLTTVPPYDPSDGNACNPRACDVGIGRLAVFEVDASCPRYYLPSGWRFGLPKRLFRVRATDDFHDDGNLKDEFTCFELFLFADCLSTLPAWVVGVHERPFIMESVGLVELDRSPDDTEKWGSLRPHCICTVGDVRPPAGHISQPGTDLFVFPTPHLCMLSLCRKESQQALPFR